MAPLQSACDRKCGNALLFDRGDRRRVLSLLASGSVFPECSLHPAGAPDGEAELTLRSTNLCSRKTLPALIKSNPSHTLLMLFQTHTTSGSRAELQEATLPWEKQVNNTWSESGGDTFDGCCQVPIKVVIVGEGSC